MDSGRGVSAVHPWPAEKLTLWNNVLYYLIMYGWVTAGESRQRKKREEHTTIADFCMLQQVENK